MNSTQLLEYRANAYAAADGGDTAEGIALAPGADIHTLVENGLRDVDSILRQSSALDYPMLGQMLSMIIAAGGKRLRPTLTFLAAEAVGDPAILGHDREKLGQVAAAVEMLHTASLVHDDTIDESLMRRGMPTLNSMLKGGTVILVGDYLFAQSAILITKPGNPLANKIFAECLATICDGELTQIFSTRNWQQDRANYHKRIYAKTAVLFETSCVLGALISGATDERIALMRRFGHDLGMAFQIIDDIIDFQPAEITGKPTGGDLKEGHVTAPTMAFFKRVQGADAELVKDVIEGRRTTTTDITRAADLIRNSGAIQDAYDEAREFITHAKETLRGLPESAARDEMARIADYALARQK